MGDSSDGSSGAAQRAQGPAGDSARKEASDGFLKRLVNLFAAPRGRDEPDAGASPEPAPPGVSRPGMMNLLNLRVEDVAVPRAEIKAVPMNIQKDELVKMFRETGLSRLPVYEGTLDNPVGMVHLKDLALKHGFNGGKGRFSLKKLLRPLLFVPPSMPIGVLLQKMQNGRIHMALVVDEYGGVDGLVTIEDLIEQVIGEIEDEHDIEEGRAWIREAPGCYLVKARAPLDEFEAEIGMKLTDADSEEEVDTLGGLVFLLLGHVPARGEVVVHPRGPEFEVIEADPRRIKRLRVRLPGPCDEAAGDGTADISPSAPVMPAGAEGSAGAGTGRTDG